MLLSDQGYENVAVRSLACLQVSSDYYYFEACFQRSPLAILDPKVHVALRQSYICRRSSCLSIFMIDTLFNPIYLRCRCLVGPRGVSTMCTVLQYNVCMIEMILMDVIFRASKKLNQEISRKSSPPINQSENLSHVRRENENCVVRG